MGYPYYETSAKKNIGLRETFEDVFEQSFANKFNEKQNALIKLRHERLQRDNARYDFMNKQEV